MAKRVVKKKIETKKRRSPSKKKSSKRNSSSNSKVSIKSLLFKLLITANIVLFLYFAYLFFYDSNGNNTTSITEKMNRKNITKSKEEKKRVHSKEKGKSDVRKKVTPFIPKTIKENVTIEANKYIGMKYKFGGKPNDGEGIDNSHLMFSIISNSEKKINNGKSSFQYKTMSELIKDSYEISLSQLSNGDLVVLKDGMIGMIIDEENRDGYSVIYVSGKQKKVVKVESSKLGLYWLNKKNKKGYYRLNYLENK